MDRTRIQFIHESVRDFLKTTDEINPVLKQYALYEPGSNHDNIARHCRPYLRKASTSFPLPSHNDRHAIPSLGGMCKNRCPLLPYIAEYWLQHVDLAHSHGFDQTSWLLNYNMKYWRDARNLSVASKDMWYRGNLELLYILADNDCAALITAILQTTPVRYQYVVGTQSRHPLYAAISNRRKRTMQALLRLESIPHRHKTPEIACHACAVARDITQIVRNPDLDSFKPKPAPYGLLQLWQHPAAARQLMDVYDIDEVSRSEALAQALFVAISENSVARAEYLLALKPDLDVNVHTRGQVASCMSLAASEGFTKIVRCLHLAGADINDVGGKSLWGAPLFAAASNGHVVTARYLLANKAEVDLVGSASCDASGFTALHAAAGRGDCDLIDLLLEHGADVNKTSAHESTPLHVAARFNKLTCFKRLLDAGSNIYLVTSDGRTIVDEAIAGNAYGCIELLLERKGLNQPQRIKVETFIEARKQELAEQRIHNIESSSSDPWSNSEHDDRGVAEALSSLETFTLIKWTASGPLKNYYETEDFARMRRYRTPP